MVGSVPPPHLEMDPEYPILQSIWNYCIGVAVIYVIVKLRLDRNSLAGISESREGVTNFSQVKSLLCGQTDPSL